MDADDPNILVLCCKAFIHRTSGALGGNSVVWEQVYLSPSNTESQPIAPDLGAPDLAYASIGMEPTVGTWIHWVSRGTLRVSLNDIASVRSTDGGATWSFAAEHWETPPGYIYDPLNPIAVPGDVFMTLHTGPKGAEREFAIRGKLQPGAGGPYSATEMVTASFVNAFTGSLHALNAQEPVALDPSASQASTTMGVWKDVKYFGVADPQGVGGLPVWLAVGPGSGLMGGDVVYVAVAHSTMGQEDEIGGVWHCQDPPEKIAPTSIWSRIPGTGPHPFNIKLLKNGARMLLSKSAFRDVGVFQKASGVAVFDRVLNISRAPVWIPDGTVKSDPGMLYWTQDVVVDPRNEDRWWACVWRSEDPGGSSTTAGLYRTMTGGVGQSSWERILGGLDGKSITSGAVHPTRDEMYVCTRFDGLWFGERIYADANLPPGERPNFYRVDHYPFRAPTRVFYRKFSLEEGLFRDEVWVISNGNGLHLLIGTDRILGVGINPPSP